MSDNIIPINRALIRACEALLASCKFPEPTAPYNILLIDRSGLMKMMTDIGRPKPEFFLPVRRRSLRFAISVTDSAFEREEVRRFIFYRQVGDTFEYREDY